MIRSEQWLRLRPLQRPRLLQRQRLHPRIIRKKFNTIDIEYDQITEDQMAHDQMVHDQMIHDQYTIRKSFQCDYVFLSTYNMYIILPILILLSSAVLDMHYMSKYDTCNVNKYFDFDSVLGGISLICLIPFIYLIFPIPKTYLGMPNLYYVYVVFRSGLLLSIFSQIIINIEREILYNNTIVYNCILTNYVDKITEYNIYMGISIPIKLALYTILAVSQFIPLKI
mgnify:CR=1 FL=1